MKSETVFIVKKKYLTCCSEEDSENSLINKAKFQMHCSVFASEQDGLEKGKYIIISHNSMLNNSIQFSHTAIDMIKSIDDFQHSGNCLVTYNDVFLEKTRARTSFSGEGWFSFFWNFLIDY